MHNRPHHSSSHSHATIAPKTQHLPQDSHGSLWPESSKRKLHVHIMYTISIACTTLQTTWDCDDRDKVNKNMSSTYVLSI